MLLGVDDMDIFKGINLKLLAMEQMLKQHPDWQGRIVVRTHIDLPNCCLYFLVNFHFALADM